MEGKIRVGIIGLGGISYAHEAGYSELGDACQIVAMCDINEEEVNNRIGMFEGAKGYTRYTDLLADPEIDMVDVIVPHVLHYEIAKAALERGKHVLVEKPITVNSEQGAELIALAKQKGLKFSVA
jgi:predicted dehydrogenase